ncbi:MAG: sodium:proton antiporter, partial [Actinocatenispora sp.]
IFPRLNFAEAVALGAVISPTDAVAATSLGKRLGLPPRLVTILEGESLVNDATALVTLRVATGAVIGATVSATDIAWHAALAVGGGLAIGAVVAMVVAFLHRRTTDPLLDNALSLLTPFVAFFPAELADASGVVAVVTAGLYLGHRWPLLMSAASRLQMDAFWRMVRFLLEGAVFLLVGLQIKSIVAGLHESWPTILAATGAVTGTVIIARFVWMYPANYVDRLFPRVRARSPRMPVAKPTVIAWAGMRGVVTLAAAFSLPRMAHGAPFPGRDLFLWLAFSVIIVTLVLQGLTLSALVRRLRLPPDDPMRDALAEAAVQQRATRAGLARLDELAAQEELPGYVLDRLRGLVENRTNQAWERLGDPSRAPSAVFRRLRQEMLEAERAVFRQARDEGRIPEEVLRRTQRDMDLEESLITRDEEG